MLALLASPDRTINRGTSLAPHDVDAQSRNSARPRRYLDVIVSRLRRKGAQQNIDVPIRSVRGEGYSFVSECLGPNADNPP
jgi:DNA-binding response OmpR family regulator